MPLPRPFPARGGAVDETARPGFVAAEAHDTYQLLLQAILATRQPWDAYAKMQEDVAALNANDQSDRARTLRRQTATHWEYGQANEARTHLRWAWHEFFKTHDALIAPIAATPAFEHDHQPVRQTHHRGGRRCAGRISSRYSGPDWRSAPTCLLP